jgi:ppGpp synthetase/RelA/SpoT-type nucleotidyltranferase
MTGGETERDFDFDAHSHAAVAHYLERRSFYESLAVVIKQVVQACLEGREIKVHSVEARAKDPVSLRKKAAQPSEGDPSKPKYRDPLLEITDLAAARIIAYFPNTLGEIDKILRDEFQVVEHSDKGAELIQEERFGYQSVHYLVKLNGARARLPEYEQFADSIAEIQVRTILQHAWAEIEHDIQYKSTAVIPTEIRRRFMALAGVLEMADREFQAIQDADKLLAAEARTRVERGQLSQVEITPDALKAFLNKKLGADRRMSAFSYDWTARMLRKLGFRTLAAVEKCIDGFDDDSLSRLARGFRQGQLNRFEYMLLAGMGDLFVKRHAWAEHDWFVGLYRGCLDVFRQNGVAIRTYDPLSDPDNAGV